MYAALGESQFRRSLIGKFGVGTLRADRQQRLNELVSPLRSRRALATRWPSNRRTTGPAAGRCRPARLRFCRPADPSRSLAEQRQNRVGSGADVLGGRGNPCRAVVAQLKADFGVKAIGNPSAANHAPTQCQAVALHRADFGVAVSPAEFFRAGIVTLDDMPRGKRQILAFVDLRFVEHP